MESGFHPGDRVVFKDAAAYDQNPLYYPHPGTVGEVLAVLILKSGLTLHVRWGGIYDFEGTAKPEQVEKAGNHE